ncbi:MAG: hypothetical protein RL721_170 [Candidatus Eisenbacteria bacterium]|jgi:hypothetical protein
MRRSTPILVAVVLILAALSAWLAIEVRRRGDDTRRTADREQQAEDRYARAIADIASIQDSLDAITPLDPEASLEPSSLGAEQRIVPSAEEALARIASLRASIDRARTRIQGLEDRMRASGQRLDGLDKLVARLKADLVEREGLVTSLTDQVDSLTQQVSGLSGSLQVTQAKVVEQEASLEDRRRELATVWYVIGDRRTLLRDSLVVARGGVLGMGRTLAPSGRGEPSLYRPLDTDHQSSIEFVAQNARVLTPQTVSSYVLERVPGGMELRIVDSREFRKVRQLVIVTE